MSHSLLALLTVPVLTGVIGYVTNWTGVLMLFYPVHFKGIRAPWLHRMSRLLPYRMLAGNRTRSGEQKTKRAQTDAFGDSLYKPEIDFDVVERADEVAQARGVPTPQMALAWLLHKPGVTAPIVGPTKLAHLEDALAAEKLSLSDEEIQRLEELYQPHAIAGHA